MEISSNKNLKNIYNDLISDINHKEKIIMGNGNILLSCPHCVVHFRNGKLKSAEPETVTLAYYINKGLNIPYIYKTNSDNEDANYDPISNYKDLVIDYIKNNNIKLFIDLHQLKSERNEYIDLGIANGKNINDIKILNCFIDAFEKYNIKKVFIDEPFSADGENVLSSYVHTHCNIDSIQIEINSILLYDNLEGYNNVLNALIDSLKRLRSKY